MRKTLSRSAREAAGRASACDRFAHAESVAYDKQVPPTRTLRAWRESGSPGLFVRGHKSAPWFLVVKVASQDASARAHLKRAETSVSNGFALLKTSEVGDDPVRDTWEDASCIFEQCTTFPSSGMLVNHLLRTRACSETEPV